MPQLLEGDGAEADSVDLALVAQQAQDVANTLLGVFLASPGAACSEQTGRMLDLVFAGIRA